MRVFAGEGLEGRADHLLDQPPAPLGPEAPAEPANGQQIRRKGNHGEGVYQLVERLGVGAREGDGLGVQAEDLVQDLLEGLLPALLHASELAQVFQDAPDVTPLDGLPEEADGRTDRPHGGVALGRDEAATSIADPARGGS